MKDVLIISENSQVIKSLENFLTLNSLSGLSCATIDQASDLYQTVGFKLCIFDGETSVDLEDTLIGLPLLYLCDIPVDGLFLKDREIGNINYIFKPFKPLELRTKIHQILENQKAERFLSFGDIRIDLFKKLVSVKEHSIKMEEKEKVLLVALIQKNNQVIPYEKLSKQLGLEAVSSLQSFNHILHQLRSKLREATGGTILIKSFYGKGFRISYALS